MSSRSFVEDINRLFDELVGSPWKRLSHARRPRPTGEEDASILEARLPARRGDLSVSVAGNTVTVTVRRRTSMSQIDGATEITADTQQIRQESFTIPEGARVESVEAAFEDNVLRVRLHLKREKEGSCD